MRTHQCLMYCFIVLIIFCLSCSSAPTNSKIENTSTSRTINNSTVDSTSQSNAVNHEVESNINISPSARLEREALDFANDSMKCCIAECDGSYYWGTMMSSWGTSGLKECKHISPIEIKGQYHAPANLSEADRLNGVDPQPIEWEGEANLVFETCRQKSLHKDAPNHNWGQWNSNSYLTLYLKKTKGKWNIAGVRSDVDDRLLHMDCSVVQKYKD